MAKNTYTSIKETLAYRMMGDHAEAAAVLANEKQKYKNAQSQKRTAYGVAKIFDGTHNSQLAQLQKEGNLTPKERQYIDASIDAGITEFEIRQIESELSFRLGGSPSFETGYHTIMQDGKEIDTIVKLTLDRVKFDIVKSYFELPEFITKGSTYCAIENYILFKMKEKGYRFVEKTGLFPGTLRFSKTKVVYKQPGRLFEEGR